MYGRHRRMVRYDPSSPDLPPVLQRLVREVMVLRGRFRSLVVGSIHTSLLHNVLNGLLHPFARRHPNDGRSCSTLAIDNHNRRMAAYQVACRKFLACSGVEIHPHEAQACSIALFKPIHDGRGLRSRHSVVGVEEE
jgi:hypothetical protein